MYLIVLQRIFLESLIDVVYFPLWWYTLGAKHALFWCVDVLKNGNHFLAPGLWLRNIFVPMYGQYDFQGRVISFFMRFINFIGRSLALCFWVVVCLFLFMIWLVFPGIITYGIIHSFIKL